MKPLLYLFILFLLSGIAGCSREHSLSDIQTARGEWQWQQSTGTPGGNYIAPINNTRITLQLSSDSSYTFYLNNTAQDTGHYQLQNEGGLQVLHLDRSIQINQLYMEPDQLVIVWDSQQLHLQDKSANAGYHHYFTKAK